MNWNLLHQEQQFGLVKNNCKMKKIIKILPLILFFACKQKPSTENHFIPGEMDSTKNQNIDLEFDKEVGKELNNEFGEFDETNPMLGERIDGPANLRKSINGKIIFSLNDNILVEATNPKNSWCEIGLYVQIGKEEQKNYYILPNKELKNEKGETIGKTIDTVEIGISNKNLGQIVAFSQSSNIKEKSIPEKQFLDQIKKNKQTKSDFKNFMTTFNFEKYDLNKTQNLEEYFIYENSLDDPSPQDRLTLLFENDTLIGFIHTRKIIHANFKTFPLIREHYISFKNNYPKKKMNLLISKKNHFYNSID
jgi:hypothetical protein